MLKKYLMIGFKGFCMGIADIIPGVSGGTIAFLMGIYEELIDSLSSFDREFLKRLGRGEIIQAFAQTGWKFLTALVTGILAAIFSLSHVLRWLLQNAPVYVNAFFFGLIITTVFVIAQKVRKGDFAKMAIGLVSAVVMYNLVGMIPLQTPDAWWFVFVSGMIAICAMILPGISGAFILLLLGKYEYIITAVSERQFSVLIIVALGCIVGLLTFVRLLKWLLHRYYDLTLSVLAGLVLGSLRRVWPWRETLEAVITPKGKLIPVEQINVLPSAFTTEIVFAALFLIVGICLSLCLARFDQPQKTH